MHPCPLGNQSRCLWSAGFSTPPPKSKTQKGTHMLRLCCAESSRRRNCMMSQSSWRTSVRPHDLSCQYRCNLHMRRLPENIPKQWISEKRRTSKNHGTGHSWNTRQHKQRPLEACMQNKSFRSACTPTASGTQKITRRWRFTTQICGLKKHTYLARFVGG